ncbi:MAG: hypothetical protein H7245_01890 [Candidatus Saccharibacteria bacterium]|nr:hypothetical protein [Pseudorhodobacter sp.]
MVDGALQDVVGLGALPMLGWLDLAGNQIASVEGLRGAESVTHLILSGNPVSNLTSLESLPKLISLWVAGTGVRDLAGVAGLVHLTDLTIGCQMPLATPPHDGWDFTPLQGRAISIERWNGLPLPAF